MFERYQGLIRLQNARNVGHILLTLLLTAACGQQKRSVTRIAGKVKCQMLIPTTRINSCFGLSKSTREVGRKFKAFTIPDGLAMTLKIGKSAINTVLAKTVC